MSELLIRAAFETRLKTWADAQVPAIPIAFENVAFTPPQGRYLRAFILPARTVSRTIDGQNRQRKGVLHVSIVLPIGAGAGAATAIEAALEALFPLTEPIVQGGVSVLMITPMCAAVGASQEADRFVLPVSAQYQCDHAAFVPIQTTSPYADIYADNYS